MISMVLLLNVMVAGFYCLINAVLLAGLFLVAQPQLNYKQLLQDVFVKTVFSVIIVFGFFALVVRMFCWTAAIAQCLECICPVIHSQSFIDHMNFPASILFFVLVSLVQTTIVAIPRGLSPATFVVLIVTSNLVASLLKLGVISLLV